MNDPLQVQEGPMDFNVTEYKKLIGIHLTFKKLPLVEFWCTNKEEFPELSAKITEIPFLFQKVPSGFSVKCYRKT